MILFNADSQIMCLYLLKIYKWVPIFKRSQKYIIEVREQVLQFWIGQLNVFMAVSKTRPNKQVLKL